MAKRRKRRKARNSLPTPVWVGGLVGVILIAAGLITLTAQQDSNPNVLPYPNVTRVPPDEAHSQQLAGSSLIIDVRGAQFYQESHAAGAWSVPEEELLARIDELPADKTLIFY
jgi:hypothetical protein